MYNPYSENSSEIVNFLILLTLNSAQHHPHLCRKLVSTRVEYRPHTPTSPPGSFKLPSLSVRSPSKSSSEPSSATDSAIISLSVCHYFFTIVSVVIQRSQNALRVFVPGYMMHDIEKGNHSCLSICKPSLETA